jgi:hypothetical protein
MDEKDGVVGRVQYPALKSNQAGRKKSHPPHAAFTGTFKIEKHNASGVCASVFRGEPMSDQTKRCLRCGYTLDKIGEGFWCKWCGIDFVVRGRLKEVKIGCSTLKRRVKATTCRTCHFADDCVKRWFHERT